MRKHFCEFTARGFARFSAPRKICLNCTIPALVKSRVGSPAGISEALGTKSWPRLLKKSMKLWRTSLPVIEPSLIPYIEQTVDDLRREASCGEKARGARLAAPLREVRRLEGSSEDAACELTLFTRIGADALGDPLLDVELTQLVLDSERAEPAFLPSLGTLGS